MKLELYKPYKTRAGHKAVVVKKLGDSFYLWHEKNHEVIIHNEHGKLDFEGFGDCEIESEWVEPRSGEFWVNVFDSDCGPRIWTSMHMTKDDAEKHLRSILEKNQPSKLLARKRVRWVENDTE